MGHKQTQDLDEMQQDVSSNQGQHCLLSQKQYPSTENAMNYLKNNSTDNNNDNDK